MSAVKTRNRRKPKVPAGTVHKVVVDFPELLFREAEEVIAELSTTRSSFVRLAVEEYIRRRREKNLREQLIEGYTANARVAREIAEELSQFD